MSLRTWVSGPIRIRLAEVAILTLLIGAASSAWAGG